jgi:hypothetical protein
MRQQTLGNVNPGNHLVPELTNLGECANLHRDSRMD